MAYCLQGLAVIHVLTRGVSGRGGILFAVYFTFLVCPAGRCCSTRWSASSDSLFGAASTQARRRSTLITNRLII